MQKKLKNQLFLAYFFQFYPGKNWMAIGEILKDVRNAGQKLINHTFSQKVMVTNALSWVLLFRNMI